ncbi:MAG: DsbA family protein [Nanoarchaeota archaeon]
MALFVIVLTFLVRMNLDQKKEMVALQAKIDGGSDVVSDIPDDGPSPIQIDEEVLIRNGHVKGNENAPITIVEYSDFQCPYCARFHSTMNQIMSEYPNDVKWVYKHFPLDSIHPIARKAAEASECAADQDSFWEYADELYSRQSILKESELTIIAEDIGLNIEEFDECLSSNKYSSKVSADRQDGSQNGITGTPGSFLNGRSLGGAMPYEELKKIIDSLLE